MGAFSHGFQDPDAFASAMLAGSYEYLPLPGQAFRARLDVLALGDLVLQVGEQEAHTARGAVEPGRCILILPLCHAPPRVRMNGQATSARVGYLAPGGQEFHSHSETGVAWGALAVPEEMLAGAAEMAPQPLPLARMAGVLELPEGPRRRLAGAIAAASLMTRQQPEALFQPGRAEGLALSMQDLLAEALSGETRLMPRTRATREAYRVVRDAEAFLEAHLSTPIFRQQLCQALGVSLRKLHDAFLATTGMSPLAYLKMRRLLLARRALRRGGGDAALVKGVALAHGFWHFGHFAEDYRAQFGETPSQTRFRRDQPESGPRWIRGVPP